ncbi:unnamed protein product [Arabis nemorensis]|uniref:Uncharacterized protein n=1 Tax=Arabis nemorensis TaxID=586526 RepID=A0A565CC97_9BRAS|nr:unnamed protein product [Arabis nemorensis]
MLLKNAVKCTLDPDMIARKFWYGLRAELLEVFDIANYHIIHRLVLDTTLLESTEDVPLKEDATWGASNASTYHVRDWLRPLRTGTIYVCHVSGWMRIEGKPTYTSSRNQGRKRLVGGIRR